MVEKLIGYEEEIKRNDILSVQINLLNRCASRCVSCKKYTWPDDKLNISDIKNVIDVLNFYFGLKTVVLSGGDPVLYEDIIEVIEYLKEKNIYSSMITTGITKKIDVINAMIENLYRIHLSLDACNAADYNRIRGVDAFDIVDENIEYISKKRKRICRLPIRLSSTISKLNYDKVYDLYEYAKIRGCTIKFFFVHTFGDLYMNDKEIEIFYRQLLDIACDEKLNGKISNAEELVDDKYNKHKSVLDIDCACYVPYISCVINANGDIYPCCRVFKDNGFYGEQVNLAYGNIVKKSFNELIKQFNNRAKFYPIVGNEECKQCGQRYQDLLQHLCRIKEKDKRGVLFI